ncbi:MAG: putative cytosolic protein [Deltaproteobacteria bacterium]|nr:putative cytosolic protein [Deltaproteobacteria bacterium]
MGYIREPSVSGTFYSDNPKTLTRHIEAYLKNANIDSINGEVLGLISPHAGYVYSGQVAAYGYKAIIGYPYETVIIVAPSHRSHFEGVAMLEKGGYLTPLGVVPIDEEFTGEIVKRQSVIRPNVDAHRGEHSLEVQVPFLQVALKNFAIVPLIMGSQDPAVCEALADCLHGVINTLKKRILVVGSTDLSHYYPYAEAVELDTVVRQRLEVYDIKGLQGDLRKGTCEACGAGPMISTMLLSQKLGATGSKVLKYANSGDVSGDRSGVVGYISCVFYKN